MAGQIIPRGKNRFLVRAFVGRDANGKRRYVSETVHGGKRAAEAALSDLVARKAKGTLRVRPKETVGEYLDVWLETTAKPSVRPRTLHDYTTTLDRYVRPHLAGMRLARLTPVEVRRMLVRLRDRGLAPRTVRKALEVLRNALEQAVSDGLITNNPARARLVKKALPQKVRRQPVTVTEDDVAVFLDVVKGDRLEAFWLVQLFGGLRPSETLALTWDGLNGDTLSITRVLVDKPGMGPVGFAPPKSATSRRAVPLPPTVTKALQQHRQRQAAERLAAGPAWEDGGLIFCDPTGKPLRQDALRGVWGKIKKAAGLPARLRIYDLRHSCATLLLGQGVPLKVVSERLGHSTIALTSDVYSHVSQSMQQQAADVLEKLAK
jgi:integrase